MKQATAALAAHIGSGETTLTELVTLVGRAGFVYRWALGNEPIMLGASRYEADAGVERSAIVQSDDMSVTTVTLTILRGAIDPSIIERALLDNAELTIDVVNAEDPGAGTLNLFTGRTGAFEEVDEGYQVEGRGVTQRLLQATGELYSSSCRADVGDDRCRIDLKKFTRRGRVVQVIDDRTVIVSFDPIELAAEPERIDIGVGMPEAEGSNMPLPGQAIATRLTVGVSFEDFLGRGPDLVAFTVRPDRLVVGVSLDEPGAISSRDAVPSQLGVGVSMPSPYARLTETENRLPNPGFSDPVPFSYSDHIAGETVDVFPEGVFRIRGSWVGDGFYATRAPTGAAGEFDWDRVFAAQNFWPSASLGGRTIHARSSPAMLGMRAWSFETNDDRTRTWTLAREEGLVYSRLQNADPAGNRTGLDDPDVMDMVATGRCVFRFGFYTASLNDDGDLMQSGSAVRVMAGAEQFIVIRGSASSLRTPPVSTSDLFISNEENISIDTTQTWGAPGEDWTFRQLLVPLTADIRWLAVALLVGNFAFIDDTFGQYFVRPDDG